MAASWLNCIYLKFWNNCQCKLKFEFQTISSDFFQQTLFGGHIFMVYFPSASHAQYEIAERYRMSISSAVLSHIIWLISVETTYFDFCCIYSLHKA